jgi:small subunit ribosomal protein S8
MPIISTDPVADMLTRLRNAIAVRKHEVAMPHSKLKEAIAVVLKRNGFVVSFKVSDAEVGKTLTVDVSTPETNASISHIQRVSTPGRRVYVNVNDIPTVKQGRGIVVVSTSKGVMTGKEAKAQGVGGELLCEVY